MLGDGDRRPCPTRSPRPSGASCFAGRPSRTARSRGKTAPAPALGCAEAQRRLGPKSKGVPWQFGFLEPRRHGRGGRVRSCLWPDGPSVVCAVPSPRERSPRSAAEGRAAARLPDAGPRGKRAVRRSVGLGRSAAVPRRGEPARTGLAGLPPLDAAGAPRGRLRGSGARVLRSRVEGWQKPGSSGASVVRRTGK